MLASLGFAAAGCCGDRSGSTYSVRIGVDTFRPPAWNGRTDSFRGAVRVYLPDGAETAGEMIEIYRDAARVDLLGARVRRPLEDGCDADILEYRLSDLEPGSYMLVHRLSSAPRGLRADDSGMASTFEGELALVTTLVLSGGPPTDDASGADAGR